MALVESLIAVLIFVIGILGLMGLQASMTKNTVDARYRVEAAYVAQKRIAEIWATPSAIRGNLAEQNADIAAESGLPGGVRDTLRGAPEEGCNGNPDCYVVEVRWTPPGSVQHKYSIVSHIQ
ncbi:MAG: prepilin-type cleavage/methylation domain-containing protein [Rhodocyclaceae bacterium]|nr:prepilin-type cleavage/methylation domain-containing protein [Rhodocyclaceae bacterium]